MKITLSLLRTIYNDLEVSMTNRVHGGDLVLAKSKEAANELT